MSFLRNTYFIILFSLSLFSGCGRQGQPPALDGFEFADSSSKAPVAVRFRRVHLIKLLVENNPALSGTIYSVDAGIKEERKGKGEIISCELVSPRSAIASKQPWAPLDFYTNSESEEERAQKSARRGEQDLYFVGDDNNRVIKTEGTLGSYDWTLIPMGGVAKYLRFLEPRKDSFPSEFSFLLTFGQGNIKFQGMLRIVAIQIPIVGCTAFAYLCREIVKNDDHHECANDKQWAVIKKIVALFNFRSTSELLKGLLLQRELFKLIKGYLSPVENPMAEPEEVILAEVVKDPAEEISSNEK